MFRNIVKMGLVVTLFLVLVGGAVYILVRPTDARAGYAAHESSGWSAGRQAARNVAGCEDCGAGGGRGAGEPVTGGRGAGWSTGGADRGSGQRGTAQRAQAQSGDAQGQGGQANSRWNEAAPAAWEAIEGTVVESGSELLVDTGDAEILVGLGQAWYREEQGFSVAVGDTVRVDGFYEDGEFKAGTVENVTAGTRIVLRDASGRPMWSGRGNRQNQA